MRLKPPALGYAVVQRLYNRRITLRRDEADGGYQLLLETCLSKQDADERLAEQTAEKPVTLRRGRILVTRLALSNEAMGCLMQLHQQHELQAATRRKERSRRQQVVVSRLAAMEEATLDAELRTAEQVPLAPKPPRTPRAKKGEK
jgi:hypothetical protein